MQRFFLVLSALIYLALSASVNFGMTLGLSIFGLLLCFPSLRRLDNIGVTPLLLFGFLTAAYFSHLYIFFAREGGLAGDIVTQWLFQLYAFVLGILLMRVCGQRIVRLVLAGFLVINLLFLCAQVTGVFENIDAYKILVNPSISNQLRWEDNLRNSASGIFVFHHVAAYVVLILFLVFWAAGNTNGVVAGIDRWIFLVVAITLLLYGQRSALLGFFLFCLIFWGRLVRGGRGAFLWASFAIGASALIFGVGQLDFEGQVLRAFDSGLTSSSDEHRINSMLAAVRSIAEAPLFGGGDYTYHMGVHNIWLATAVNFGIMGLIFPLIFIVAWFLIAFKWLDKSLISLLVVFLINSMTHTLSVFSHDFITVFALTTILLLRRYNAKSPLSFPKLS